MRRCMSCGAPLQWRGEANRPARISGGPGPMYDWAIRCEVIIVIDLDGERSVTNSAERVIEDLANALNGIVWPVVYRDTSGRYDQLEHNGSRFIRFRLIGATDESTAIRKVKEMQL